MQENQNMKTRSDQKRIIAGSILTVICIVLCFVGVWGCLQDRKSGSGQTEVVRVDSITPDNVTRTMDEILKWQCARYGVSNVQELLDTAYAERAVSGTVQNYVMGLYGYMQEYDYACYYSNVQAALRDGDENAMSLQRSVMILSALQAEIPVSVDVLEETIGEQGIMSYLYGLLMLDGMAYEGATWSRTALIQEILSRQLADGGFAVTGAQGDVDVTAMALQALAPYYLKAQENAREFTENGGDERLVRAVEDALFFLSKQQLTGGDFENSGTPNAESTAQVILALCALGRDVWTDEAFIKNGNTLLDGLSRYHNADGGFGHTEKTASNDMAASQAFAALSAVNRAMQGKCFLFDLAGYERDDDAETGMQGDGVPQDASEQDDLGEKSAPSGTLEQKNMPESGMDMRVAFTVLILAADCAYLAYLCFSKKYSRKRLYGVALVTAVSAAALWLIRIQTREDYLRQDSRRDGEKTITVSLEIYCDRVAKGQEYLPPDGVILAKTPVFIGEGASVFDVLKEAARAYDIPVEYEGTAAGNEFAYVEGIAYLYEYDYGELSGWTFSVNGETSNVGCGAYRVADGDEIVWYYTTELGRDT